ncbi:hypothetical protein ACIPY3_00335 [Paenarthrobacter sp. NPDC089714]|uniref:hypothetical protein n=1 Tax=Paenarthrobacter sp. NPDC089714 TaxID=3364377 RepID=UPI0038024BF8
MCRVQLTGAQVNTAICDVEVDGRAHHVRGQLELSLLSGGLRLGSRGDAHGRNIGLLQEIKGRVDQIRAKSAVLAGLLLVRVQSVVVLDAPCEFLEMPPLIGVHFRRNEGVGASVVVLISVLHNVSEDATLKVGHVGVLVRAFAQGTHAEARIQFVIGAEHPSADRPTTRWTSLGLGGIANTAERGKIVAFAGCISVYVVEFNNQALVVTVQVCTRHSGIRVGCVFGLPGAHRCIEN